MLLLLSVHECHVLKVTDVHCIARLCLIPSGVFVWWLMSCLNALAQVLNQLS